ncbi:MAG: SMR family transporter [Lysobacterales bacterium]
MTESIGQSVTQGMSQGMTWAAFALILTGVLLNAFAQLALKASVSDTGVISLDMQSLFSSAGSLASNLWLWVGLICYGISVIVWILALSRVDVSIAYPMLSIGYIVNAVAAWHLFDEPMNIGKVVGIGVIILGVYILARS